MHYVIWPELKAGRPGAGARAARGWWWGFRSSEGGDDTVGNPPRARIFRFESFELIILLKLDKRSPVEQLGKGYLSQQHPPPPLN